MSGIIGMPPNGELGQVTKKAYEGSVGVLGVKSEQLEEGKDQTKKNWNGIWPQSVEQTSWRIKRWLTRRLNKIINAFLKKELISLSI